MSTSFPIVLTQILFPFTCFLFTPTLCFHTLFHSDELSVTAPNLAPLSPLRYTVRHTEHKVMKCFHFPPPIKIVFAWGLLLVKQMPISYEDFTLKRLEISEIFTTFSKSSLTDAQLKLSNIQTLLLSVCFHALTSLLYFISTKSIVLRCQYHNFTFNNLCPS